jgi:pimeloyl-ACP methyl ester carboxylesterase
MNSRFLVRVIIYSYNPKWFSGCIKPLVSGLVNSRKEERMLKPMSIIERSQQSIRELKCIRRQLGELFQAGPVAQERLSSGPVVIFLHGIMAGGAVLQHVAEWVRRDLKVHTLLFSYSRWVWTIDELEESFSEFMDEYTGPDNQVILVGHSLGGMIARMYTQRQEYEGLRGVITMATPHEGTLLSKAALPWVKDLFLPDGPVIQMLRAGEEKEKDIPHVTIAAEQDQIIYPRSSAVSLSWATQYWIEGAGHNEMLYHPALRNCLQIEIQRLLSTS